MLACDAAGAVLISRVEIDFAEAPSRPWMLESAEDGHEFTPLHLGEPGTVRSVEVEFELRTASAVRVYFPEQPIDIEEIRVH